MQEMLRMSFDDYLAIPRDSFSSLELFRRCRRSYYRNFILGESREPTASMRFGTKFHSVVEQGLGCLAVAPDVDRRTKKGKQQYDDFLETHQNRIHVTEDEFSSLQSMRNAFMEMVSSYHVDMENCLHEHVVNGYTIAELPMKSRIDIVDPISRTIWDVKTIHTATPDDCSRAIVAHGYHRQSFIYRTAMAAVDGPDYKFRWAFVSTTPPYNVVVACPSYQMDMVAADQVDRTVEELLLAKESQDYMNVWEKRIVIMDLPPWEKDRAFEMRGL
jgi:exodeoxyribonuclease VIII